MILTDEAAGSRAVLLRPRLRAFLGEVWFGVAYAVFFGVLSFLAWVTEQQHQLRFIAWIVGLASLSGLALLIPPLEE